MSRETKSHGNMTLPETRGPAIRADGRCIKHSSKVLLYPDGSYDLIVSTSPDFGPGGWEEDKPKPAPEWGLVWTDQGLQARKKRRMEVRKCPDPKGEDTERAMRRARSHVRRLALANDFRWFVTLTLNKEVVGDRCDAANVTKHLNTWLSNMVQRHGLRYVLVPERHEKGGIHFHGFFNDLEALRAVDSGHTDKQGHKVYNLEGWKLGFTTAIELYGEYSHAVAYVCKYIGKGSQKIGGRWYYSGGALQAPVEKYADLDFREVAAYFGTVDEWKMEAAAARRAGVEIPPPDHPLAFQVEVPGKSILVVNGIKPEGPCE